MDSRKGFTLVEAAVAIGVVAILSGIIIPLVLKNIRDAQMARARNDIQVIAGALASQLKDTGRRPLLAGGPNNADGSAHNIWGSGGFNPYNTANPPTPVVIPGNNTFENLLAAPPGPAANVLFNYPQNHNPHADMLGYRGPYLAQDMAAKSDPWGRRYLILGYNAVGQAVNGPIWIVSAGPKGRILDINLTPVHHRYPETWTYTGVSEQNIAVRIN